MSIFGVKYQFPIAIITPEVLKAQGIDFDPLIPYFEVRVPDQFNPVLCKDARQLELWKNSGYPTELVS
jgi:hypothetical protein